MGYARHIGRVGALAVTLGVGVAIATTPGIASADPLGSATSTGDSSSTGGAGGRSSSTAKSSVGSDAVSTGGFGGTNSSGSDLESSSGSANKSARRGSLSAGNEFTKGGKGAAAAAPTSGRGDEDTSPAGTVEDDSVQNSVSGDSAGQADELVSSGSSGARTFGLPVANDRVDSTVRPVAGSGPQQAQTFSIAAIAGAAGAKSIALPSASAITSAATTVTTAVTSAVPAPVQPQQSSSFVSVVSNLVSALLQPLAGSGDGSPIQMPMLTAMLSLVRNEFERVLSGGKGTVASQQTSSILPNPTQQHVLVIGVDGTNLSRILADDYNQNFFELMDTSTTAAASIVGHTTISNPSWSAILTGVWGERTGVINNVFTPWTYDKWPTVFNQLESLNPDIYTMAIADWHVINGIAGAGSIPADRNIYVPQIEGDTNWLETDDRSATRRSLRFRARCPELPLQLLRRRRRERAHVRRRVAAVRGGHPEHGRQPR